ncbi:leucine-rich repeat and immunoglobulin-like domain-containing nogo receptor-interacting protein 3 [Amphibalanus amphitrite]|uniref:leucine-rich repeat and immunoglobulin-like domain-containing nogo receptor-interacting protein 3 n=1 Tax=Amphibalanus amphitrite TaxID=1232801 RepID=UPI001C90341F|nr:leucine-rich repeat and immunoglobulin-like domain-containing nogo receptor-interacting protein 3 [Amphibalanus amphitrite]
MAAGDRSGRVTRLCGGGRLLLLAAVMAAPALADACPVSCHCRWKGGKKTVECVDRQLESLPTTADTDTQVLDISGHALTELASRAFQRHGLLALQRIYVSRGRLERVGQRALSGLTNLVELDLSENRLTAVPGAALRDVPALRRLSLSGNPLERIQRGDLGAVRELTALELAHCQLRIVEKGAFATLLRLEKLQLQGNQLTTLAAVDLSLHLHNVQLQSNLWHCNCRLRELRRWLRQYPVPLAVPPRCSAPRRLSGRAVHNTSATELACAPDILPSDRLFEVSLNSSVTLSCAAEADPAAELSWWFKGHILKDDPEGVDELGVDGGGAVRRSQLVIASAGEHDHGVFRCRAANAAGASTADFRVSVLLPPDTRSSGTAPASRSHLALPVGGSLVLLAASALLLLGALAVRRGRRLRRRRKFSTSRDSGSGESAGSPTGGGGGPLAPPAGFGDELPAPAALKCGPPPRWAVPGGREQPGVAPSAVFAARLVAAEKPADSPDEGYVESVQDT